MRNSSMKSPDCIELLISVNMSPLSSLETKARRWNKNIPCPFIYPWLHEILQTNYWWPQSHLLVVVVAAALAQDQPPYCWPQLLLSRADVSPFALAVKFYWAVLQIQGSIFYLSIAGDLSRFVQHSWICLGCPQAPPPGHVHLFWQASGLVYGSCGGFASLPTHVLEEEPHLAAATGRFGRLLSWHLAPPSAPCQGAGVLCWAVLLGHFPEFHISSGLDVGLEISPELASFGEFSASLGTS